MLPKIAITASFAAAAVSAGDISARFADSYTFFQGDGSAAAGWPSEAAWGSYEQLFDANKGLMEKSCGFNGWGADNSAAEIASIDSAIRQVAQESGVDNRAILAVVMQESKGCVRVPTTDNGVKNPGLMQSHNGQGSCAGVNPCPASQILQMIRDGVTGTPFGPGIQGTIQQAKTLTGDSGARAVYTGARIYNSGSATVTNLDDGRGSTVCYAADVANRLTGWTLSPSACH